MFEIYHKWSFIPAIFWLIIAILDTYRYIIDPSQTTIFGLPFVIISILNWICAVVWTLLIFIKGD